MRFDPQTHAQMFSVRGFSIRLALDQSPRAHETGMIIHNTSEFIQS